MKHPWSASTITLISILCTPIVGGILGGRNQIRLGYSRRRWPEYAIAVLAFAWYSLYFYFTWVPKSFIIPQYTIVLAALYSPLAFLAFFALPSAAAIYAIFSLQRQSWKTPATESTGFQTSPWSAYLAASLLTPIVGLLLYLAQFILVERVYFLENFFAMDMVAVFLGA